MRTLLTCLVSPRRSRRQQLAEIRDQRSEVRVKATSGLGLLTSGIDGFQDFKGLNDFNDLIDLSDLWVKAI
jgi:hypothetical protein